LAAKGWLPRRTRIDYDETVDMDSLCIPRNDFAAIALLAAALACAPARAASDAPTVDVRRGMEATFSAAVVDGRISLGPARVTRLGTAQPRDGEITVGVEPGGMTPYAQVRVSEKTAVPLDFVATGLIDNIKIDEITLCGRLDRSDSQRIAAGSLHVSLNRFAIGTGTGVCR
jgi:hypothetical protein